MGFLSFYGVVLILEAILLPLSVSSHLKAVKETLNPSPFSPNFLFGTASSSYQYVGAYLSDGKGLNNCDVYSQAPSKQNSFLGKQLMEALEILQSTSIINIRLLDPIILGRYPREMVEILGSTLPEFSHSDQEKLNKGLDFIGINHYTSFYAQGCIYSLCQNEPGSSKTEGFCRQSQQKNGVPIGQPGMEKIVTFVKDRYNNIPMFITENGYGEVNNPKLSIEEAFNDMPRVEYIAGHLDALTAAMRKGEDVTGYFVWSFLDNFEWRKDYTQRFGLHYVDYACLKRTPKLSATWFREFYAKHKISKSNI